MPQADGSIIIDAELNNKKLESDMGKLDRTASNALKGIITGFTAAAAAAVAFGVSVVSSYAEYEQLVGGVDTLFKESSGRLQQYAENAYKTAGLSANQYMSTVTSFSSSLISSLGGDTEKAVEYADMAITDMSDNANKFGSSMESIQNAYQGFAKQNYTMLDNLKLGFGGTKEEMQRLLEEAGKISGLEFDISSFADITQAIHIMQESMGVAGTTALEAEETISGSISTLKASWQNFITGLGDSNADVSKLAKNVVDSFGTVADNTIPVIETIVDNIPGLRAVTPLIISAAAALAGWAVVNKVVNPAMMKYAKVTDAATTAVARLAIGENLATIASEKQTVATVIKTIQLGLEAGQLTATTAAQYAYNAAVTAAGGPVSFWIMAAAALVAGLFALGNAIKKAVDESEEYGMSAKELSERHKELTSSMAETEAAFLSETSALASSKGLAASIASEIQSLIASQDDLGTNTAEIKARISELNAVVPGLNASYNEQTNTIDGLNGTLEEYVALMFQEAELEVQKKRYIDLLEQQREAQELLNAAKERMAGLEADGLTNTQAYRNAQYDVKNLTTDYETATAALDGYREETIQYFKDMENASKETVDAEAAALNSLSKQYGVSVSDIAGELERLNIDTEEWEKRQLKSMNSQVEAIRDFAEEHGGSYAQIEAAIEKSGLTAEEWVARQEEAYKRASEALAAYTEGATQLYDRIETKSKQSIGQVIGNLDANAAAVEQYGQDLLALDGNINENLFASLQEQGPEKAAATARMLASASETELQAFNDAYTAAGEAGLDAYETVFGKADTSKSGEAVAESTADGIEKSDAVKTAAETMIDDAHSAALDHVNALDFSVIGKNMMDGIIEGITSGTSSLLTKIREAVASAHAEAQKADSQKSPSQWWKQFGLNDMEGWAEGFRSGRNRVISAQNDVMALVHGNAIAQMQTAILGGQNGMRLAYATASPAPSVEVMPVSSGPPIVIEEQNVNMMPSEPYAAQQMAIKAATDLRYL